MAGLAMFTVGWLLTRLLAGAVAGNAGVLVLATMGFALAYFVLNALLVTPCRASSATNGLRASDLIGVFGWVGMAYSASAVVATLLYLTYRQSGAGVLMATVPVLAMMLATLHLCSASRRPTRPCAAPAPKPPSAKPRWPPATCRNWRPASGASTAPSRTLPSAWPCWPSTAASCRPTRR
jgi:hypothetical protein